MGKKKYLYECVPSSSVKQISFSFPSVLPLVYHLFPFSRFSFSAVLFSFFAVLVFLFFSFSSLLFLFPLVVSFFVFFKVLFDYCCFLEIRRDFEENGIF
jgi:hypothetical protein